VKVYIAGSSADLPRARAAADSLQKFGVEVTSTWWNQIEKYGEANPTNSLVRETCARQDIAELDAADVLWQHVVASGMTKRSIFCALVLEFERDDDARFAIGLLHKRGGVVA
jgi:hypothetical protein